MLSGNYSIDCPFLSDPKKALLNRRSFSVDYSYANFSSMDSPYVYYIIDNTQFPANGAQPSGNITLQSQYETYVENTKHYMTWVLACKFLFIERVFNMN